MRYTVQYIPLNKLRTDTSCQPTQRSKELRLAAQDFMHLLIVRKNKKEGGYSVVCGNHHLEYIKKHTKKRFAPCLIDESKLSTGISSLMYRLRIRKPAPGIPYGRPKRLVGSSWSIIRTFLKQEPRFQRLSRRQQIKVLRLGLQFKKTTVQSMKAKVDHILNNSFVR